MSTMDYQNYCRRLLKCFQQDYAFKYVVAETLSRAARSLSMFPLF